MRRRRRQQQQLCRWGPHRHIVIGRTEPCACCYVAEQQVAQEVQPWVHMDMAARLATLTVMAMHTRPRPPAARALASTRAVVVSSALTVQAAVLVVVVVLMVQQEPVVVQVVVNLAQRRTCVDMDGTITMAGPSVDGRAGCVVA